MSKTPHTYINNLGIVNALGASRSEVAANLLHNSNKMVPFNEIIGDKSTWIGKVTSPLIDIPSELSNYHCRNNQLLATAYHQISNKVESLKSKYGKHRIGIVLGTSTSGIASGEEAFKQYMKDGHYPDSFHYLQQEIGSSSEFLAQYANIAGYCYTISTACSSSGKAIAVADRLIKADLCDAVVVGGSDSLCQLTLNGFNSLELLSSSICNPFSVNRSGINIGEGAALFILSKEPAQIKLLGTGESSDGYHITAPDPTGTGAKLAIHKALESAKIVAQEIGYINLHGTGTEQNDKMESRAVNAIFGDSTLCSSTKPLIGHTLGASGALELGFCWLLLSDQFNTSKQLPAQVWDQCEDPELAKINLVSELTQWKRPIFISNSFAFGGSNVSLIIKAE